jgi:hypothetical protein
MSDEGLGERQAGRLTKKVMICNDRAASAMKELKPSILG